MGAVKFEDRFDQYRERLHDEFSRLFTAVAIYRRLHERKKDRLPEMNMAPAFFGTVMESLRSVILISIHRLFHEQGEAGIFNFLTLVEYNRTKLSIAELKRRRQYPDEHWMLKREEITLATIEGHRSEIRAFSALRNIAVHRDKVEAHSDKTYFFNPSRASSEAPIKWSDLDKAIELLRDVLNTYSTSFDGHYFYGEPLNALDVDHLLDALHTARRKRLAKSGS